MERNLNKKQVMLALLCHNEAASIAHVLDGINETFPWSDFNLHLYIFDNGSSDNLHEVLDLYRFTKAKITPVYEYSDLNLGYAGNGFKAINEFRKSKMDYLLIVDGDGEFPPCYVNSFLAELQKGNDLVLTRRVNASNLIIRNLGSIVYLNMCRMFLNFRGPDLNGGFRGLTLEFANELVGVHRGKTLNPLLYSEAQKNNYRITWVDLQTVPRLHGESFLGWRNPIKMFYEGVLEIFRIRHQNYEYYFSNDKK